MPLAPAAARGALRPLSTATGGTGARCQRVTIPARYPIAHYGQQSPEAREPEQDQQAGARQQRGALLTILDCEEGQRFRQDRMLAQEAANKRFFDHVGACAKCETAAAAFADDDDEECLLRNLCVEGNALDRALQVTLDAWESWPRDFLAAQHPNLLSPNPAEQPYEVEPWLADLVPGPAVAVGRQPLTATPVASA